MTNAFPLTLDDAALRQLLAELGEGARESRFEVAPNPCVGAAVLAAGNEVARGFHRVWGGDHAEVEALEAAARSDVPSGEWDTLVVTLEPCSSRGKTGPCTERILETGIRRLVVGATDPDPRHRGMGIEVLREAGVEVDILEGATPLERVAPHFVRWTQKERLRRPRPWTIAKWAQTRSGQLVPPPHVGDGRRIASAESLAEVQLLRSRVDAIVTGVGTVLADDPRLTVRPPADSARPPLRVVLDSVLRTPPEARLFAEPGVDEGGGTVHLLCQPGAGGGRHRALEEAGASIFTLPCDPADHVALREVMTWLWEQGAQRVMLEAGPTLLGKILELGFVDQLRVYTGDVLGGEGPSLAEWLGSKRFGDRLYRECGPDSVLEAFLERD